MNTPDQLAGMSDGELEKLLHKLLSRGAGMVPKYCESWGATGPLMFEHDVWPVSDGGNHFVAFATPSFNMDWSVDFEVVQFSDSSPLRAVVECLILVLQEGE